MIDEASSFSKENNFSSKRLLLGAGWEEKKNDGRSEAAVTECRVSIEAHNNSPPG